MYKISILIMIVLLIIGMNNLFNNTHNEPNDFNDIPIEKIETVIDNTSQDLKVLVIEINPVLESITNTRLYPNNNGHPKVSEYFGQDTYKALEELKEDLEFASHGYLNIKIQHEYLNEFPRYKGYISRNQQKSFR